MTPGQSGKADPDKAAAVREMLDARNYVFKAQMVSPSSGRTRHLTSDYDLKVSQDKVEAYLPYFGRAYSAPMDPSKGGIKFSSSQFTYNTSDRKKGGWLIQIEPKDEKEVQQLTLTVSEAGYATLQVISTNRQPISFNGIMEAGKETDNP
ncbi:DUF4251 domain-containing protein [Compostibacter hankyongensis]|uniref:DUF4251 domain-containing protein n=2 Tax=Compostibacter hankyongensis TaxID=1007089 RepID=A0ABP8FSK2_9BACT